MQKELLLLKFNLTLSIFLKLRLTKQIELALVLIEDLGLMKGLGF